MFLLRSYIPFLLIWIFCILTFPQVRSPWEKNFLDRQEKIKSYLNKVMVFQGQVITHPVPSRQKFSYMVQTNENFRIQISSKSYQAPNKGDLIEIKTKLFVPSILYDNQKIKEIDAYGTVFGDHNWKLLVRANLISTRMREKIFKAAQDSLSPTSYGYFRAMVFGDQALLNQSTMDQLKITGLLHLFVVSGSHIMCAWSIGFWLFRFLLGWSRWMHRQRKFFLWIEVGSILSVFVFLEWINPPISSFRAVGSMVLFLILRLFHRYQHPLWNLGIVFFATLIYNPFYLFDISTQLTFASVAGIILAWSLISSYHEWIEKMSMVQSYILKASSATLGATLFTQPILYFHLGVFYPMSFFYNLILVPTLGVVVSFVSVSSLVWALLPLGGLKIVLFWCLDQMYLIFERILFWKEWPLL